MDSGPQVHSNDHDSHRTAMMMLHPSSTPPHPPAGPMHGGASGGMMPPTGISPGLQQQSGGGPAQQSSFQPPLQPPVQPGAGSLLGPLPPPPPPMGPPARGSGGPPPPPSDLQPQQSQQYEPQADQQQPPIQANKTIYVNNLNSKIKLDQLKRELRAIFENFGTVRDVIAMSSFWRRGQAWIVFADQDAADKALSQLQGFPYSGKDLRLQYARELSDIIAKEEGTFVQRPPGPKKPRAIIEREKKLQGQLQQFQQMMLQQMQGQQSPTDPNQPVTAGPAPGALGALFPQVPGFPFPQMPQGLPPQLASLMIAQMPPNMTIPQQVAPPSAPVDSSVTGQQQQQQQIRQQQQQVNSQQRGPTAQQQPSALPMSTGWDRPQARQPQAPPPSSFHTMAPSASASPGLDLRAVPPPAPVSKDAMVAAAAAAAAQAVEAAARKRVMEVEGRSPGNKIPRVVEDGSRFTSHMSMEAATRGFSRPNPSAGQGGLSLPNTTLFVENLPEGCDGKMLEMVFKQYPGCGEIRLIEAHRVAFVEYESVAQSSVALRYLNNFQIKEGQNIRVTYAK